jgi:hypothetical protein
MITEGPDYESALCAQADPEAFFPEKGGQNVIPKALCNGAPGDPVFGYGARPPCPCRFSCLWDALENNERYGVWGGMSERERRALSREPLQGCEPPPAPAKLEPRREASRALIHVLSNGRRNRATRV